MAIQIESGSTYLYRSPSGAALTILGSALGNRGDWAANIHYAINDAVTYEEGLYIALRAQSGIQPTQNVTVNWSALVRLESDIGGSGDPDQFLNGALVFTEVAASQVTGLGPLAILGIPSDPNVYLNGDGTFTQVDSAETELAYTALTTAWTGTSLGATALTTAWYGTQIASTALATAWYGTQLAYTALQTAWAGTVPQVIQGAANIQVTSTGSGVIVDLGTLATTETTWFGPSVGSHETRTYAGTFTVDFAGSHSAYETVTLAGSLHFIVQNMAGPDNLHGVSIRIIGDGADRDLTYQAGIRWLGTPPTAHAAGKIGIASFTAYGPSVSDVLAVYATEQ
jgi:hypothetical protein